MYTLLYIKQLTNKDLLYSTGNSTQYLKTIFNGKESKKEDIYIYIYTHIYMYIYIAMKLKDDCSLEEKL